MIFVGLFNGSGREIAAPGYTRVPLSDDMVFGPAKEPWSLATSIAPFSSQIGGRARSTPQQIPGATGPVLLGRGDTIQLIGVRMAIARDFAAWGFEE